MDITLNDEISTKSTNQIASSRAPCNFDENDYNFDAEWVNWDNDPCGDLQFTLNGLLDCDECSNCSIEEYHITIVTLPPPFDNPEDAEPSIRFFDATIRKGALLDPDELLISPAGWILPEEEWTFDSNVIAGNTFVLINQSMEIQDVEICIDIHEIDCEGPYAEECTATTQDEFSFLKVCKTFRFACEV